eukprot:scaffold1038_cov100-Cylindrotheca_fusiformis.AAC.9
MASDPIQIHEVSTAMIILTGSIRRTIDLCDSYVTFGLGNAWTMGHAMSSPLPPSQGGRGKFRFPCATIILRSQPFNSGKIRALPNMTS